MYRIVKVDVGEEVPPGVIWRRGNRDRAVIFLAQECLSMEGRWRGRGDQFLQEYSLDNRDYFDEGMYTDEDIATEELWVLTYVAPPLENEFGRVSP